MIRWLNFVVYVKYFAQKNQNIYVFAVDLLVKQMFKRNKPVTNYSFLFILKSIIQCSQLKTERLYNASLTLTMTVYKTELQCYFLKMFFFMLY